MEENKLSEIASQLRQPHGEKGLEIAEMMHASNFNMTSHAIENLQLQPKDIILEIGHGNAKHLPYLFTQEKELVYHGLENSTLMHEEAQKNNADFLHKNAFFHWYKGEQLPFDDNRFSKIFTVNTIYFWPSPIDFFQELCRVLSPNGLLNITFAHAEFMKLLPFTQFGFTLYEPEQIKNLAAQTPLKFSQEKTKSEIVKSKQGEEAERLFTTLRFTK